MDLKEAGLEGMDWIAVTEVTEDWRAVVNTVMNLLVQ
jgi:hypothetical protein